MAFNPDAYLAKTAAKGFDPDAYLSKAEGPVDENSYYRRIGVMPQKAYNPGDKIGTKYEDGTEYVGDDPRTGTPMIREAMGKQYADASRTLLPATVGLLSGPAATYTVPLTAAVVEPLARKMEGREPTVGSALGAGASNAILPGSNLLGNVVRFAGGNLLGTNVESLVDRGELANQDQNLNAVTSALIAAGLVKGVNAMTAPKTLDPKWVDSQRTVAQAEKLINRGGAVAPGELGYGNRWIQGIAGKEFMQQQASIDSERALRGMAREGIGLSRDGMLTNVPTGSIDTAERMAGRAYSKVSGLSDNAAETMQQWKAVRDQQRALQASLDSGGVPPANAVAVREQIKALGEQREQLQRLLDAHAATAAGTPEAARIRELLDTYHDRTKGAAANKARFDSRQAEELKANPLPRAEATPIGQFESSYNNLQVPERADNPMMRDALLEADQRLYEQKTRTANSARNRAEQTVEKMVRKGTPNQLADELSAAKKQYAIIEALADSGAINSGAGKLNPQALAAYKNTPQGQKLTDELLDIAMIAEALPRSTQDATRIGAQTGRLAAMINGPQVVEGALKGDVIKAAGASVPFFGSKVKDYYLSPEFQKEMIQALKQPRMIDRPLTDAELAQQVRRAIIIRALTNSQE